MIKIAKFLEKFPLVKKILIKKFIYLINFKRQSTSIHNFTDKSSPTYLQRNDQIDRMQKLFASQKPTEIKLNNSLKNCEKEDKENKNPNNNLNGKADIKDQKIIFFKNKSKENSNNTEANQNSSCFPHRIDCKNIINSENDIILNMPNEDIAGKKEFETDYNDYSNPKLNYYRTSEPHFSYNYNACDKDYNSKNKNIFKTGKISTYYNKHYNKNHYSKNLDYIPRYQFDKRRNKTIKTQMIKTDYAESSKSRKKIDIEEY